MSEVRVISERAGRVPHYATPQSAGADLRANLPEPVTLAPMQRAIIPTGLRLAIPEGMEGQVRPRSGLAIRHGVTVLNAPGTIDADYRGEVGVILVNLSDQPFTINDGDRIAQIVFAEVKQCTWVYASSLEDTERGAGGFGSTGAK